MRQAVIIAGIAALVAAPALGDELVIEGFPPYTNVQVSDVVNGTFLVYNTATTVGSQDLSKVTSINIVGQTTFNDAEAKRAKQPAEAAKLYAQVVKAEGTKGFLGRLARLRRVKALDDAKKIDEAVTEWLTALDEGKNARTIVAMRPQHLGAKGSAANKAAIKTLDAKLPKITDTAAADAVKALLVELYTAQGEQVPEGLAKAASPAPAPTGTSAAAPAGTHGPSAPAPTGTAKPVETPVQVVVTAEARDEADKKLPDLQGRLPAQPQEVLDEVRASLALYSADALPDALLLVARAQVALAQEASDAYRKMLLEDAALEAMKVYVNYAPSPKAGQSLLLAGDAMAALGNQQAARKAYEKVVKEFKQSDSAAAAQAALDKMIAK